MEVQILKREAMDDTALTSETAQLWHALDPAVVVAALAVNVNQGLEAKLVEERRRSHGLNVIPVERSRSVWQILKGQFVSIVVGLLVVAAAVAAATGDNIEASAILVVLVINAAVGFATEWKAERALSALRGQARTRARVRRDGREISVDAAELVPGDLIVLNAGDYVPADARLLESSQLQTEESALTGESASVGKETAAVASGTALADRRSMVYLGTAISSGHALAAVVATGTETELGKIGRLVALSQKETSPLERRVAELGRRLVVLVLFIAALVILAGWLRGDPLGIMAEVGISLAVAAVPEGLPAVTTLILALGVLRMARQRAIVRRLAAVETLGSTTVICSDKTGTLTENRMTVREYYLADGRVVDVGQCEINVADDELLERALRVGVLCNEAAFQEKEGGQQLTIGDPTETALLVVADTLVVDVRGERARHPKLAELPFHSTTKRMTTLHRRLDGQHFAALKGAPAVVLDACSTYVNSDRVLDANKREEFLRANEQMAGRALRVLALAIKHFDGELTSPFDEQLAGDYTFLGFVGLLDPPRPGVAEAIRVARRAGIRTVMLTGDQLQTGIAIARELGLGDEKLGPRALHARDLAGVEETPLAELARTIDVFARVSPEDKLRIVAALQEAGEIVAVTGDGVNDAPALKRANIGVAMGARGTDVAKESADVVLADDNFSTIVRAVEGGRAIYSNILKFVHLMFSHNLGEVIMIFVAIVVGWPLPLLPLQILWMNLVTDVFPALSLAVEPASPEIMNQPPRKQQASLLSRSLVILITWQAAMVAGLSLAIYAWALDRYGAGAHARTIALLGLIGTQLGHLFNCRSRSRSAFSGLGRNPFIWIATAMVIFLQFVALYVPPVAKVLATVEPEPIDWLVISVGVVAPILIVEVTKMVARSNRRLQIIGEPA